MKRDEMPGSGRPPAGLDFPALFGRGIDVAKESLARFPGSKFAPGKLSAARLGDGGADAAKRDGSGPSKMTPSKMTPAKFAASFGFGPLPVGEGAVLNGPQKLVSDLRAYSGIRHREAVRYDEPVVLGRLGNMEVRLARTARDVRKAQRLRYKVFYEEKSAIPDAAARLARRDVDAFDTICDHILVLDYDAGKMVLGRRKPKVVGTYRLLRQDVARKHGGFYTQGEFDVNRIVDAHPGLKFLELGRSCVLKPYRNKRTVELLWHGVWTYVLRNNIDVMFGCASLDGTDPTALALPLSFLHHHARAPQEWSARALPARYTDMNLLPKEQVDLKSAMHSLPPLVKGYLRLGGYVGDGAVVDHQFGTTDVLIVLPRAAISPRYVEHFGPSANRHAI